MVAGGRSDGRSRVPRAVELFRGCGWSEYAQVWARWLVCPLAVVESYVPEGGRVLEVGCGRGITSFHLGLADPQRSVLGIDIDATKIGVAERAATQLQRGEADVSFQHHDPGVLPEGEFDAIVFADSIYLFSDTERDDAIRQCVKQLAPGGMVVIKEVSDQPRWKHALNVTHNALLRFVLHNLAGELMNNIGPDAYVALLEDAGLTVMTRDLGRGYPYAHFLVVGRASTEARAG